MKKQFYINHAATLIPFLTTSLTIFRIFIFNVFKSFYFKIFPKA